jgi:hypothetical protein
LYLIIFKLWYKRTPTHVDLNFLGFRNPVFSIDTENRILLPVVTPLSSQPPRLSRTKFVDHSSGFGLKNITIGSLIVMILCASSQWR